jgi:hypothetical protein
MPHAARRAGYLDSRAAGGACLIAGNEVSCASRLAHATSDAQRHHSDADQCDCSRDHWDCPAERASATRLCVAAALGIRARCERCHIPICRWRSETRCEEPGVDRVGWRRRPVGRLRVLPDQPSPGGCFHRRTCPRGRCVCAPTRCGLLGVPRREWRVRVWHRCVPSRALPQLLPSASRSVVLHGGARRTGSGQWVRASRRLPRGAHLCHQPGHAPPRGCLRAS